MIEGMSSSPSDSQAARQTQAGMFVLRQAMEQERQIAQNTVQQVQATEATSASKSSASTTSNPDHMGNAVDTYA